MSNLKTLRNWGAVLLLLLLAGSAALWPTIRNELSSSSTRVEPETQTIEINLPISVGDTESVTLTSLQAMGILLAVVAAAVVGGGVVLAFAYSLLARQVNELSESETFQAKVATLEEKNKVQLKQLSEDRSVASIPDHEMPRWSVLSTSLIILLFVTFFGMLINVALVPEGEYQIAGRMVNSTLPVVGGFVALALILILWRMRPKTLRGLQATDGQSIPWDFIWVLLSGLLVVGLGIGALVYLNVPA